MEGKMEENNKFLSSQTIFRTIAFLILINTLFLDVQLSKGQKTEVVEKTVQVPIISDSCPASCMSEISNATQSVTFAKPIPTPIPTLTVKTTSVIQPQSLVKEFFVPFGAGSNSSDDWQDIPGLSAMLDSANYKNIKTVTFEASVRIPNGNEIVYVRLYNATDKHPVWFSEVSVEGAAPQLLISKPITLDGGNKTYQVQMKTSLKFLAFLDQSRLHIIIN
jgi:hypothetical protein